MRPTRQRVIQSAAGVAIAALCVVSMAAAAGAAPPQHFEYPVDFTAPAPYYTALCGFSVSFTLRGTLKATLFTDQSGSVVREVDSQPGTTQTFTGASGRSFSFPSAATLRTRYSDGAAVGSPAVAVASGLGGHVPGLPADAGEVVFGQATVVAETGDGVPIIDLGPITALHGHSNDPARVDQAICAALAP